VKEINHLLSPLPVWLPLTHHSQLNTDRHIFLVHSQTSDNLINQHLLCCLWPAFSYEMEPLALLDHIPTQPIIVQHRYYILYSQYLSFPFSALTLLIGRQEGHLARKKRVLVCWW